MLGGTRFVGRAVVDDALRRGWDVTVVNRGATGTTPPGVTAVRADRTAAGALEAALAGPAPGRLTWDLVVDTWSGDAAPAAEAARLLVGRSAAHAFVSTVSVYAWGHHVDESSPVIDPGGEGADPGDYAVRKRAAELGVLRSSPDALLPRPGMILGPHEDVGRLPWWLSRMARGGRVLAPGRPERPLQLVDARDLASWVLDALVAGTTGPVDVISRSGHTTTRGLLEACRRTAGGGADLVWVDEASLAEAGVEPWTQLPCWVPEVGDAAGFLESDTSLAAATGLVCRPVEDTVRDTWAWMRSEAGALPGPGRPSVGLPEDLERAVLAGR